MDLGIFLLVSTVVLKRLQTWGRGALHHDDLLLWSWCETANRQKHFQAKWLGFICSSLQAELTTICFENQNAFNTSMFPMLSLSSKCKGDQRNSTIKHYREPWAEEYLKGCSPDLVLLLWDLIWNEMNLNIKMLTYTSPCSAPYCVFLASMGFYWSSPRWKTKQQCTVNNC